MSKSFRILLVDDEANARAALAELLGEEGYTVRTAADGLTALSMLGEFAPEVVLTHLTMPGLDGYSLLQKIHQRDPACAVIIMSALSELDKEHRQHTAGFLSKPIDFGELLRLVEQALAARPAG
jgi:DNA-binding NtrC family response regulator